MSAPATLAAQLAAEDLEALAWLHEEERLPASLTELFSSDFCSTLSILPAHHPACQAMADALQALAAQPAPRPQACADDLAADYAAIYLTYAFRAAPYESVWRDEEHLMMQGPTFAVRGFYERHGFHVSNWRHMPDDHLTHQLRFIASLLRQGKEREAARFIRSHLMVWLPLFAERVVQRAQTRFYAALAQLTLDCVTACQNWLPVVAVIPTVQTATPADTCSASPC